MRNRPYKTCPYCGSHLDYGETCDCIREREAAAEAAQEAVQKATANPHVPALAIGA